MRSGPLNAGPVKADTCAALRTAEIKASFDNIAMQVMIVGSKECVIEKYPQLRKKLVVLRPMGGGEKQARKDQPFPDLLEVWNALEKWQI